MSTTLSSQTTDYMRWVSKVEAWYKGRATQEDVERALAEARAVASTEANQQLDALLIDLIDQARSGLLEANDAIEQFEKLLDRYTNAPLIPATFLEMEDTPHGPMAVVSNQNGSRAVAMSEKLDPSSLQIGQAVFLSSEQNVLAQATKSFTHSVGEVGTVDRYTEDRRLIMRSGPEDQIVVRVSSALCNVELKEGDLVRWDRHARLALEKIPPAESNPYALEELDELPMAKVGGQGEHLERLQTELMNGMLHPEIAARFGVKPSNTILLYGPPGVGKTYLTRAAFCAVRRLTGKRVVFSVIRASQWENPYVGVTESNIRQLFAHLRKAAEEGCIVALFIDEIDSVGRVRGSFSGHHSDKSLNTLLTEMSGFAKLSNVSIVGAVNRKDLLDSALLSRFSQEIPITRPTMRSAREMFEVHLTAGLPCSEEIRQQMIDLAISRLFAPNADTHVCTLKLRDGVHRQVTAAELVSARLIEQISESAGRNALARYVKTGAQEVKLADMEIALEQVRRRMADELSPRNAHNHLDSLSEDDVVVGVEPVVRRVSRPLNYVTLQ